MQTRWPTTVANTSTHYGYGSVNITAWRCKCKRVCDSCRSPLPGVKYDLLFHSRHNDRDRTVQVGHEMSLDFKRTNKYWKLLLERILALLFICIVTNWTCSIVECLWTQNALSRHYHKMYMGFQPAGGAPSWKEFQVSEGIGTAGWQISTVGIFISRLTWSIILAVV